MKVMTWALDFTMMTSTALGSMGFVASPFAADDRDDYLERVILALDDFLHGGHGDP